MLFYVGIVETAGVVVVHRDNEQGRRDLRERNSAARWVRESDHRAALIYKTA